MTVENMKTGFVERIGGTIFVVNAMPAENAKHKPPEGKKPGRDVPGHDCL